MYVKDTRKQAVISAFTLIELLLVLVLLVIFAFIGVALINPASRIQEANDTSRREEVRSIQKAIELYVANNGGRLPLTAGGQALPAVTRDTLIQNGADASSVAGLVPDYLDTVPLDPDGLEYKVGQIAGGTVLVGVALNAGGVYIIP